VALIAQYLIDTSAAARMREPGVRARLEPLITGGVVATCATLDAEALYSARSSQEYEQIRADRHDAYEYVPTDDEHWQRAFDAQRVLARTGRHRAVGIADLLTAVLAAEHRLTLVHYDADFDTAAEVIDFEHRWVAQRGTINSPPRGPR
jgi:predicted nucleic acid-binding protein